MLDIIFMVFGILSMIASIVGVVIDNNWLSGIGFGIAATTLMFVICDMILA